MSIIVAALRVIVLTTVFYLVVTPVAVTMRMLGRNRMRHVESDGGFWVNRLDDEHSTGSMQRKF